MTLPVKYRPSNFDDFVGNEILKTNLSSLLESSEYMPNTILLQGESGCGKTTLARIIANGLGTKNIGLQEFDMSKTRSLGEARKIILESTCLGFGNGNRVVIIEEFHGSTPLLQKPVNFYMK